ncbi:hypothetical protein BpHYR1_020260 [Brachionus plicatilis]|uniref:Uncharacterized protein n=1 Tax=Brachionus plicatilis TaxID=10195 RepID=A0A3M7QJM0_BRAPC|nr:hypothetical protein BpHYR1_020260 [Brachionus plicatilis]
MNLQKAVRDLAIYFYSKIITVFPCSIMQRHNLEHIIGAGAILNLAHVKFNLTCVACAKTVFRIVAMHYIQGLENGAALFE